MDAGAAGLGKRVSGCGPARLDGVDGQAARLPGWAAENGGGMVAACGYAMEDRGAVDVLG